MAQIPKTLVDILIADMVINTVIISTAMARVTEEVTAAITETIIRAVTQDRTKAININLQVK